MQSTIQWEIEVAVVKVGFTAMGVRQKAACGVIADSIRVKWGRK